MTQAKFLVKPMYEGNSMPCNEFHFDLTRNESIRVQKLEDARLGIIDLTDEEYYLLRGRQPLFYFQERFASDRPGYEWNGLLLFSVKKNIEDARKVAHSVKDELNIVLAFTDPESDRYFFLIDTKTDGGTEQEHDQWAIDICDTQVSRYFHKARYHKMTAYTNALLPEYYDILDREALFGKDEPEPQQENTRCNRTMSVGEVIRKFFSHLINR